MNRTGMAILDNPFAVTSAFWAFERFGIVTDPADSSCRDMDVADNAAQRDQFGPIALPGAGTTGGGCLSDPPQTRRVMVLWRQTSR